MKLPLGALMGLDIRPLPLAVEIPDPLWLALAIAALAGALLIFGRRGRRIGDQPHCARCNYNLRSLQSTNCPECGEPIQRASVRGQYRPRPAVVIIGALLVIAALRVAYPVADRLLSRMNPYPHYPFSLVLADAERGDGKAIRELAQRASGGRLPADHYRDLFEAILSKANQNLPPGQFGPWRHMLFALLDANSLTEEELTRYAERLLQWAEAGRRRAVFDLQRLVPQLPLASLQLVVDSGLEYAQIDSCVWTDAHSLPLTEIFPLSNKLDFQRIHRWIAVLQAIAQRPEEDARQLIVDSILDTYENCRDPHTLDPHWLQVLLETTSQLPPNERDLVRSRLETLSDEVGPGILTQLIEQALVVNDAVRACAEDELDEFISLSIKVTTGFSGNTDVAVTAWVLPSLEHQFTVTFDPPLLRAHTQPHDVQVHYQTSSGVWRDLLPFRRTFGLGTQLLEPGEYDATFSVTFMFAASETYPLESERTLIKTIHHTETIVVH